MFLVYVQLNTFIMGIPEKIEAIQEELHRTQVNKHTEHHIGLLKAKIAKLRREEEAVMQQ
jgi:hypothetical protein